MLCELCKTSLPASVYYQGNKLDLMSIDYPKKPYILLEEFTPESYNSHGIHIITIDNGKSISIGRAQDADFKISDISVSRKHALIQFTGDRFTIIDNKSKFGTLIKMKKVLSLTKGRNISIQVGRTMFHICVRKKFNLKKCCCNPFKKIAPEWSYITQEGIDHSMYDPSGLESRSIAYSIGQSGNSISYLED